MGYLVSSCYYNLIPHTQVPNSYLIGVYQLIPPWNKLWYWEIFSYHHFKYLSSLITWFQVEPCNMYNHYHLLMCSHDHLSSIILLSQCSNIACLAHALTKQIGYLCIQLNGKIMCLITTWCGQVITKYSNNKRKNTYINFYLKLMRENISCC